MYPNTPTHTEELIAMMENDSPKVTEIIQEYIDNHDVSEALEGENYYYKKNKITERQIMKFNSSGYKVPDMDATNNKLASGWHKLLVDQKVSYLVGDPITFGSKAGNDTDIITETLGDDFDDTVVDLVEAASNKGREFLHPYINSEGEFDYIVIPMEEYIPIFDNKKRKEQIAGIRIYPLDDETEKVELWDSEQVTYYEMFNGKLVLDSSEEVNPRSHFYFGTDGNEQGYGWGRVPFIEVQNNKKRVSDLTFYKDFIDAYDRLTSDTTNTLEDIQEIFYVIKGYSGTDIDQAVTNLKRYKGVAVDADGGIETVNAEVPVDSIEKFLDRLTEDIFQFGQGVNTDIGKFGNAPSGVAIRFLFSLLDMKANAVERKFTKALRQLMWFVCEYLEISGQGAYDYKDITFTFNKSILVNELENADIAQKSKGIISDETIMENHNWVSDLQKEKDRMAEQNENAVDLNMPIDGEEIE